MDMDMDNSRSLEQESQHYNGEISRTTLRSISEDRQAASLSPTSIDGGPGNAARSVTGSGKARKIAQRACDACSRRKTRCNQALPMCGPCMNKGLRCEYTRPISKRGRPATVTNLFRDESVDSNPHDSNTTSVSQTSAPCSSTSGASLADSPAGQTNNAETSNSAYSHLLSTILNEAPARHLDLPTSPVHPAQNSLQPVQTPAISDTGLDLAIPWPAVISLTDLFFDLLWPLLPIVHRPSFLQDLHNRRDRTSETFCMLSLNVCATTAVTCRGLPMPPTIAAIGMSWVGLARHLNSCIRRGGSWIQSMARTDSLVCMQNVILVAHFERSIGSPIADRLISEAERIAQAFHFGREIPVLDAVEAEIRRRAFWILYMIDKRRAILYGQNMSLRGDEVDIDLPSLKLSEHTFDLTQDAESLILPFNERAILCQASENILLRWRESCRLYKSPDSFAAIRQHLHASLEQFMDITSRNPPQTSNDPPNSGDLTLIIYKACFMAEIYNRYSVLLPHERVSLLQSMCMVAGQLTSDLSRAPMQVLQILEPLTLALLELLHRRLKVAFVWLDDPMVKRGALNHTNTLEMLINSAHVPHEQQPQLAVQVSHGPSASEMQSTTSASRAIEAFENAGLPTGDLLPESLFGPPLLTSEPGIGTLDFLNDLSTTNLMPSDWFAYFET